MRRFLLSLLVFILSLQTSWAAVHFCDESAPRPHAAAAQDGAATPAALQDADAALGALHDDQCCTAAHGGHVLQNLISHEPPALAAGSARHGPAEAPLPRLDGRFPERVERPQWSAA